MKETPRTISWQSLQSEGLGDNALVHLTGVDFDRTEKTSAFEQFSHAMSRMASPAELAGDPTQIQEKIASMQKDIAGSLKGASLAEVMEEAFRGIELFPRGSNPLQLDTLVSMPRSSQLVGIASEQIERHNEVRGFLRIDSSYETIRMIKLVTSPEADDRGSSEWVAALKQLQQENEAAPKRYTIEPILTKPSRVQSTALLIGSVALVATGLVVMGCASLSVWTWLFLPVPSILSILGMPLRRGRGGRKTRFIYCFVGLDLIMIGGFEWFVVGAFGHVGGETLHHVFGFLIASVGLAGVAGAILHGMYRRPTYIPTLHSQKKAENPTQEILSYTKSEKASMGIDTTKTAPIVTNVAYQEPAWDTAVAEDCGELTMHSVDALLEFGFASPSFVRDRNRPDGFTTALQLGCDHTVLAETSNNGREPTVRMTSVLHDGLVIVTVSESVARTERAKFATTGIYQSSSCKPMKSILAKHLQQTIRMSEKRDCKVVTFENDEKLDASLLGRRSMADIQNQYGETEFSISSTVYGRFSFPPLPVQEVAVECH